LSEHKEVPVKQSSKLSIVLKPEADQQVCYSDEEIKHKQGDVDTRCPVTSCAGRRRRLLLLRALPWPDDSQPAGLQQEGRLIGFEFVLGWMGASTAG
jgi:hypothetical protein